MMAVKMNASEESTTLVWNNSKLIEKSSPYSQQFSAQIGVFFKGFSSMEPEVVIRKDSRSHR